LQIPYRQRRVAERTGQALAWTASALLFAFVTAIIAGHVLLGKVVAARA
jgi:hypothetical protein